MATMTTIGKDGYVGEVDESSPGFLPGDWTDGRAYSSYSGDYASRDGRLLNTTKKVGRVFRIISSDHGRYKVLCVDSHCSFVVAFEFGRGFEPPHSFMHHTTLRGSTWLHTKRVGETSLDTPLCLIRPYSSP